MKKLLFILCITVLGSCGEKEKNNNSEKKQEEEKAVVRFSTELDTTYKDNSLDIEQISRTFYRGKDWLGCEADFSKTIVNNSDYYDNLSYAFGMISTLGKDFKTGAIIFNNDEEVLKFIDNIQLVIDNPDKDLRFDVGALDNTYIETQSDNKAQIVYYKKGESVFFDIDQTELDSLKSCFNRFINE